MTRLWLVETRRLLSRRLFRWLTVLALGAFIAAGAIAFATSSASQREVSVAERRYERQVRLCEQNLQRFGGDQLPHEAREDPARFCRDNTFTSDPRFRYADMKWVVGSIGIPLLMLGWLLGASSIGAEHTSRSLTQTLTWEPRRLRVISAKILAVAAVIFVWIAMLQILFSLAMLPAGIFRGTMTGVDALWLGDYAQLLLRVAALGGVTGVMGFALAAIGRNTAAALGAGFVYLAVIESLIRRYRPTWSEWLIGDNLVLWIVGPRDMPLGHSQAQAAAILLGYTAVLAVAAAWAFRRREMA